MSDIETVVQKFIDDLPEKHNDWCRYEINPYTLAYVRAHDNFEDTLSGQEELERKRQDMLVELGLLALALTGGGTLAAVFGHTALKKVAGNVALKVICDRNLERTFKAALWMEKSKAATFMAGKLWDRAGKELEAGLKQMLQDAVAHQPAVDKFTGSPKVVQLTLDTFVRNARGHIAKLARMVRDSKLSDDVKLANIEHMKNAPFWQAPTRPIDADGKLKDRIELAFYMNLVLDSDWMSFTTISGAKGASPDAPLGVRSTFDKARITARPRSSAYPARGPSWRPPNAAWQAATNAIDKKHGTLADHRGRQTTTHARLHYDEIGSLVAKRIDWLYGLCGFGGPFFSGGVQPDRVTLIRAESTLGALARMSPNPIARLQ